MHKYQITARNLYCNFLKSVGHDEKDWCTLDLMREHNVDSYIVQGEEGKEGGVPQCNTWKGYNQGGRCIFICHRRGGFNRGRGTIICYNCNQPGNLAQDYLNPCTTCNYCL
jgi:hypothetical protein